MTSLLMPAAITSPNGHGAGFSPYAMDAELANMGPTADYVKKLLSDYRVYFANFHKQCRQEEDYYFGRNVVPVPEGFDATRPATARSLIDVATDHVDTSNIDIDVPAPPRALARAERLQKFYTGTWLGIKGPVLRSAVRQAFTYGISWTKLMFDGDRWPKAPLMSTFEDSSGELDLSSYRDAMRDFTDRRCISFPFSLQNVNPGNLVWDDSDVGPRWVIEFYQRSAVDIKRRYPEWMMPAPDQDNNFADWVEYWDPVWHGRMAGGQWVWGPHPHGYGFLPYHALQPAQSLNWDVGKPEDRFQGILYPVHSLLDSEARLVSAHEAIVRKHGWPTVNFQGDQRAVEATLSQYETFGARNWVSPGVDIKEAPSGHAPPEVFQHLNLVQTLIEIATYPNVIRGIRPRGVSAGFAMSSLAGMGRLRFQGVADGAARMVEQINSGFAKLVENRIKDKVTVYARTDAHSFDQTIGPDDIKGLYENKVKMKAEAPEEREREALLGMRLLQARVISLHEAQKRAGILSPLEEQMRMEAEWLLQSPELRAEKSRLAAEGLGLLAQLGEATGVTPQPSGNLGNQFLPGQAQGPRLGEANIQRQRVATRDAQPGVFPQGFGGIDRLGAALGGPQGGAVGMPSGQTIRQANP
jgi:hypothetical protein